MCVVLPIVNYIARCAVGLLRAGSLHHSMQSAVLLGSVPSCSYLRNWCAGHTGCGSCPSGYGAAPERKAARKEYTEMDVLRVDYSFGGSWNNCCHHHLEEQVKDCIMTERATECIRALVAFLSVHERTQCKSESS
jgi:hypothetical protein